MAFRRHCASRTEFPVDPSRILTRSEVTQETAVPAAEAGCVSTVRLPADSSVHASRATACFLIFTRFPIVGWNVREVLFLGDQRGGRTVRKCFRASGRLPSVIDVFNYLAA
ncbi:hypothetical protein GTW64_33330 [Streptomyces sp. SID4923]|nr:hypothetical protein [Streptomyces sp. SID4923]